jgi:NDP-sugar pyrophosphorylase family protein
MIGLFQTLFQVESNLIANKKPAGLIVAGNVYVEEGAQLPPIGVIQGPAFIDVGADLQAFCTVIGPAFVGRGTRVGPYSSVRGSVLGPDVKIGQHVELSRSIVLDRTEIPHKNIIVDSFIGKDCWLAGEVTVANLRMDRKPIRAFIGNRTQLAGEKYGATIEDKVKIPGFVKILPGAYITPGMKINVCDLVWKNRVVAGSFSRHRTRGKDG